MFLYKIGEKILLKLHRHEGSLKNLVFASKYKNPKQLYALLCETLRYYKIIQEIFQKTKFIGQVKGLTEELGALLLYDFLFGKGLQCSGKFKQIILSRKSMFQSALARIKMQRKVTKNEELVAESLLCTLPKYLRVNTLQTTLEDVVKYLKNEGFKETNVDFCSIEKKEYMIDELLKNVIILNNRVDLHDHPLYLNGHLIFQDRSSCIPGQVLNPISGSKVIDACAAPGNKTSHLSAIMNNTGKIYAFDLDSSRLELMRTMLTKAGVTNCEILQSDFLKVFTKNPKYAQVTHILVDPSCSGSGMMNRMSNLTDDENSSAITRLQTLSNFQLLILCHALSFPKVQRVVYSTCSINDIENEHVVQQALEKNTQFALKKCLPNWKTRGHVLKNFSFTNAEKCVRCSPSTDFCNGFFVAMFQRIKNPQVQPLPFKKSKC